MYYKLESMYPEQASVLALIYCTQLPAVLDINLLSAECPLCVHRGTKLLLLPPKKVKKRGGQRKMGKLLSDYIKMFPEDSLSTLKSRGCFY